MDFNRLYADHQTLLVAAERAPSEHLRALHEEAAGMLAEQIGRMQRALGATAATMWEGLAGSDGFHASAASR